MILFFPRAAIDVIAYRSHSRLIAIASEPYLLAALRASLAAWAINRSSGVRPARSEKRSSNNDEDFPFRYQFTTIGMRASRNNPS